MDETGGAPYVYDNRKKGFELELANYLAKELGRASAPVSGEWKDLPELLTRGDVDIVLNGYEYSKQFREQASIPYYVYRLALTVPTDSPITSWADLRKPKPNGDAHKLVVLTGSAAQRYVEAEFKDEIKNGVVKVDSSDDVSSAYDLVARKQGFDATVQDSPAALYYVKMKNEARLRTLGEQRAENFYIILTRPDDKQLRADIDKALRKGIQDGTLEEFSRRNGVWTEDQERLHYWSTQPWPPDADRFERSEDQKKAESPPLDWGEIFRLLGLAASRTILLAIASFPLAVMVGLLIAVARLYGPGWLRIPGTIYVEVIRGTPLLLQLFVIFYLIPRLLPELTLAPIYAGIVGLAINYSAYEAENFRAGLQAIAKGQMEAALALGMTPLTAIRTIIVPQAVRVVIPPLTNDFIALFKDLLGHSDHRTEPAVQRAGQQSS
jgi:polar amino acid transport system substrate-binding protein